MNLPVELCNVEPDLRYGYCRCGCGQKTSIPKYNDVSKGWKRGVPLEWMNGHARRFNQRYTVNPETGCWEWNLVRSSNGYARIRMDGTYRPVHRAIFEILNGPVPEGMDIDHLCRNRRCVNPEHLRIATRQENAQCGAMAKLNPDAVREIRLLGANGWSQRRLAKQFGVEKTTIAGVLHKRTWGNI